MKKSFITAERLNSIGYSSYREYLASDHWWELKRRYYKCKLVTRSPLGAICCAGCVRSGVPLEMHHKTYKRLGREWLGDLVLFCRDCHQSAHDNHLQDGRSRMSGIWGASQKIIRKARKLYAGKAQHPKRF